MRAAFSKWPYPCNYLICKRLTNSAISTDGSLVAIPEQFRPDSTTSVGQPTLQQARPLIYVSGLT